MFYEIFYFVCELTKYVFFVQVQRMLMKNFNRQAVGWDHRRMEVTIIDGIAVEISNGTIFIAIRLFTCVFIALSTWLLW